MFKAILQCLRLNSIHYIRDLMKLYNNPFRTYFLNPLKTFHIGYIYICNKKLRKTTVGVDEDRPVKLTDLKISV